MNIIDKIREAGKQKKLMRIVYKKLEGEVTERVVEPYEIKGSSRLFAYDVDKADHIRQFIITGILQAEVLEETFEPQWPIKIT